jgi:hypothetical protein
MEQSKLSKVLSKYYSGKRWMCRETYESLVWKDTTSEKPTEEKINELYELLLIDEMREKRNELLKECDFRFVLDYPHSSEEKKEEWRTYRQSLRDLPSIWVEGVEYPLKPE